MFELFDPRQDYSVRHGNLPHWYQPGVTYFITFRTADSLPQALVRSWHHHRDEWLRSHDIDPTLGNWKANLVNSPTLEREYHQRFSQQLMAQLDHGHGKCVLRDPKLAQLVAGSLLHFDEDRYRLSDFVVMPNHVHVLTCLCGETQIERQCTSWKKYSALEINRALCQKGRFWQEESFDHLVRSPEQFDWIRRYIADNPAKAHLRQGEFLYWTRPE